MCDKCNWCDNNLLEITQVLQAAYAEETAFEQFVTFSWSPEKYTNLASEKGLSNKIFRLARQEHENERCDYLLIAAFSWQRTHSGLARITENSINRRVREISTVLQDGHKHYSQNSVIQSTCNRLLELINNSVAQDGNASDVKNYLNDLEELLVFLHNPQVYFKREIYEQAAMLKDQIKSLNFSGFSANTATTPHPSDTLRQLQAVRTKAELAREWKLLHEYYQKICLKLSEVNTTISNLTLEANYIVASPAAFATVWGTDINDLVNDQRLLDGITRQDVKVVLDAKLDEELWLVDMKSFVDIIPKHIVNGQKRPDTWSSRIPKVKQTVAQLVFISCKFLDWLDSQLKSSIEELEGALR